MELIETEENTKHVNKKIFCCAECGKVFSSKQCLKEHNFKHSNIKPYTCHLCKKKFRHASQFAIHKKLHRERKDFYWPVLAQMEKKQPSAYFANYIIVEEIKIPDISGPQEWVLPRFETFLER
jgi:hypothetical protein